MGRLTIHIVFLAVLCLAELISGQSNYWLANIQKRGQSPFGDSTYPVFRNVKDYGAKGDGVTDDTDAINKAISDGNRCGGGDVSGTYCESTTTTPALVYVPPGTYVVSKPLIMYYGTQMVGDAVTLPVIKVSPNYQNIIGLAVFDTDIYIDGGSGAEWYANQNNFFRQLRNFVIDMTTAPLVTAGIHWQVAQATSMQNIIINMRDKSVPNNAQQGIYMENGSGGVFTDIVITGGKIGATLASQQFTSRNLTIRNAGTAIYMGFDWVWLFTGLQIYGCDIGIDMSSGGFSDQAVGSVIVIDSIIGAIQGIVTPYAPGYSSPPGAGTLVLENVDFSLSDVAIAAGGTTAARTVLSGGQSIPLFAQGNGWTTAGSELNGQYSNGTTCTVSNSSQQAVTAQDVDLQRRLSPLTRPQSLTDSNGRFVVRSKPQYQQFSADNFFSAKASGLKGDGETDDTAAMQALLNSASQQAKIVFFDYGAYIVTSTINVPANVKIVGELFSIIMATGSFFKDEFNPQPVWKIGNPGESGTVEISDLMFETRGPTPGAIIVQWNIKGASAGAAGMWDAHFRIGGTAGTNLQQDTCVKNPSVTVTKADTGPCTGAFLLLHVTNQASGYFENVWGWVSDHELDEKPNNQINIYNARGFLIEGDGPTWFYGTSSEHHQFYSYQWANARNHFAGVIQHETAYYQGNPNALIPFTSQTKWNDPTYTNCTASNCARTWGARFINSSDIYIYGAGLYNFFDNYNTPVCLGSENCQQVMVDIKNSERIYLWALNTKAATWMVNLDGVDMVPQSANRAGFCATVALFEVD